MIKKFFVIFGIIVWVAWGCFLFWPDYTIQNMVLEETKDIKLPSTCGRWQRNNGNFAFSVMFEEPVDKKGGISSIENQLIKKGFKKLDSRYMAKGKLKAFKYVDNGRGKTVLEIYYEK